MTAFRRRFPGGIFPRLVALFPLVFSLTVVQGIFLGVSVTLPEVLLVALGFYFLFEHDSFREREWTLWPVLAFAIGGTILCFVQSDGSLEAIKTWMFFPLLYFVMARNVFRDKTSMLLLAQKTWLFSILLLSVFVLFSFFSQSAPLLDPVPLGSPQALGLWVAPAVVLSVLQAVSARSRIGLAMGLSTALLSTFLLLIVQAPLSFLLISFSFATLGLLHLRRRRFFWMGAVLLLGGMSLGLYLLSLQGFVTVEWVSLLKGPSAQAGALLLGLSTLWMLAKALPWMEEKDAHGRFAVATALLCFVCLALFSGSAVSVPHVFLFWLFMASLL